ncbi:MAG TPA: hypothetical protein VFG83_06120 [Kofleriaceae bacterium]|nr:hypothetical protein [Kofleriaceae bacterium]
MRTISIAALIALAALAACGGDELSGAKAEVQETHIKLDLPAVPKFEAPSPNPDGTHPVREMRLRGDKFLDTEVTIKGYVVWVYDCAQAIRTPDMTDKALAKQLAEHPEECEVPNFYLGDTADAKPEKGAWVVEVPRPPRADEKKVLSREELRNWPEVPKFALGDEITVTGTWALKSPHGATKSEGLLVYKSLTHIGGAQAAAPAPQ